MDSEIWSLWSLTTHPRRSHVADANVWIAPGSNFKYTSGNMMYVEKKPVNEQLKFSSQSNPTMLCFSTFCVIKKFRLIFLKVKVFNLFDFDLNCGLIESELCVRGPLNDRFSGWNGNGSTSLKKEVKRQCRWIWCGYLKWDSQRPSATARTCRRLRLSGGNWSIFNNQHL